MAKELFNYSGVGSTEYSYYGFHLKNGRYHIDTKRLTKLGIKGSFPEGLFSSPRNTHYFVPKHKYINDYAVSCLRECLNQLSSDWNNEYKQVISKITTPKEVFEQTRTTEMMFSSSPGDDMEEIDFAALMASIRRGKKYEEVIKSIHLQYLQKMFTEFFRALYLVIKDRGFENKNDFSFKELLFYVQDYFKVRKKRENPLYRLPHYKYLDVLNKIDNFLKHNSRLAYLMLADNPYEQDMDLKAFQAGFVVSDQEARSPYETGMYAGNWLKIGPSFVGETISNLQEFSKEFCKMMYDEDADESFWNSDEALLRILKDSFFSF